MRTNILLVEDDANLREAIADTLLMADFSVAGVHDGEAALSWQGAPPVAPSDLTAGGGDVVGL